MMRGLLLGAAIVALSACGGASQGKVTNQCTQVLEADLAPVRDQIEDMMNVPDFCDCYAGKASEAGAETLATHAAIWVAMIKTGKSIDSGDVDEIFEALEESVQDGKTYGFDSGDMERFGRFVSTIEHQFDRDGGCAAE